MTSLCSAGVTGSHSAHTSHPAKASTASKKSVNSVLKAENSLDETEVMVSSRQSLVLGECYSSQMTGDLFTNL
jgi:hypothetical protein